MRIVGRLEYDGEVDYKGITIRTKDHDNETYYSLTDFFYGFTGKDCHTCECYGMLQNFVAGYQSKGILKIVDPTRCFSVEYLGRESYLNMFIEDAESIVHHKVVGEIRSRITAENIGGLEWVDIDDLLAILNDLISTEDKKIITEREFDSFYLFKFKRYPLCRDVVNDKGELIENLTVNNHHLVHTLVEFASTKVNLLTRVKGLF